MEMAELGAGGGQGDLNQQHDLEVSDTGLVGQLMALCAAKLQGQPQLLSSVLQMLTDTINERTQYIGLDDSNITTNSDKMVGDEDVSTDLDELPLEKLVPALARLVTKAKQKKVQAVDHSKTRLSIESAKRPDGLPKRIVGHFLLMIATFTDNHKDFPLLTSLILRRAVLSGRSLQAEEYTPLHGR